MATFPNRPDSSTLKYEDRGEQIEFSITDDGPGIPKDYHDCIFGVFQTLSSRDNVESTGIGLSIVKKLVERQGGPISVDSKLGQGSAFSLYLANALRYRLNHLALACEPRF